MYVSSPWNLVDLAAFGFFAVAMVFRTYDLLDLSRGFFSYALGMLYIRLLQLYIVSEDVGSKVFMVMSMVRA